MRILHTADWHLGQTLHGVSRAYEHDRFLSWLIQTLEEEQVEALIVAGDVFDVASPPPRAQEQYYGFLAECRQRLPDLDIVVVGGNHDSPGRLDAPAGLLNALGIAVIGGLPFCRDEEARDRFCQVDSDRVIVPLTNRAKEIAAWVVAVPFLRKKDLMLSPHTESTGEASDHQRLIDAFRGLYDHLTAVAAARREPGQALLATGHLYMTGCTLSNLSERKIQVGNQYALPVETFPEALAYVALGHLHRAQSVSDQTRVRYSGSPIPLSLAERDYDHQVILVDLEGERLNRIQPLSVPRAIDIQSVPKEGYASLQMVLAQLLRLPRTRPPDKSDEQRTFLEVHVELEKASTRLRKDIEDALHGAWPRLLRIDARLKETETKKGPERGLSQKLETLSPEEVFRACYQRLRDGDVPEDLVQLFHELVEEVQREG